MSGLASSPSTTTQSSPSRLQAHCISDLIEITNQLLENDVAIRFRCLASCRFGTSTTLRRCHESCETQARPLLFDRAKGILQRTSLVTLEDYVGVIRCLFCRTHGDSSAFKKYYTILGDPWNGDGAPKELQLLEAFRRAYELLLVKSPPKAVPSASTSPDEPSSPQLKFRSTTPSKQPETEISFILTSTQGVIDDPKAQGPFQFTGSSSILGKLHVPNPPSQRLRSQSNPPRQDENVFIQSSNVDTKPLPMKETVPSQTCSTPPGISSGATFNFRSPVFNTQFPFRPGKNETAESSSSSHQPGFSIPDTSSPHEVISPATPRSVSTNPQLDGSKQRSLHLNEFIPGNWVSHDFITSFAPSGGRKPKFQSTQMPKSSKDDTFLEQLSKSVADMAPPLFETTIQHKIPPTTLKNTNGKNLVPYLPVLVDNWIRDAVEKPVTKKGFIYILKAPKYFEEKYPGQQPRVKIGFSVDVDKRIAEIKKSCGMTDLERIGDHEDIPLPWYYKVEELAHSELANFKQVLNCNKCKTAHREWFAVSEKVALQTVQRWRKFILTDPYDENGLLKDQWSQMLRHTNMTHPGREEGYDDHEKRNDRWNRWLDEGIKSTCVSK